MTNFESVKMFMETFGQEIKEKADFPNNKITNLRYELIKEELEELKKAIEEKVLEKKRARKKKLKSPFYFLFN